MSEHTVMSLKHISKTFPGVRALHDISFEVKEGEALALLGENGAGKSTLIKCLTGAHKPTEGTIELFGKEYDGLTPAIARQMGSVQCIRNLTWYRTFPLWKMFLWEIIREMESL